MDYTVCLKFKNNVTVDIGDIVTISTHASLQDIKGKVIDWEIPENIEYKTAAYITIDTSEQYKANEARVLIEKIYRIENHTLQTDTQTKPKELDFDSTNYGSKVEWGEGDAW